MRDTYRVFDAHTHIGRALHSGRRYSAVDLLRDMDRAGVDRSLVIPFPVVEDHRAAHDEIGRAVRAHRDRLTGAACLPAWIREDRFREEVRRCCEQYGFRALKVQPQYQPVNPLSSASDFLFDTARENGLALIWHTGAGIPFALPSLVMAPAARFPELAIVLAHSGGGLLVGEAIVAAIFCPNTYLDLSTLMPHHVLEVLARVPGNRLMIGSDLPESLDVEIGKIAGLEIAEADKRAILYTTACRVFGESC
jgi:predicted TIM-barrel fold metal-dependent hydrolase